MKLGIITLLGNNYGGMLQAYALKNVIGKYGCDVININYLLQNKNDFKRVIKKVVYLSRDKKFKMFKLENFKLTRPIKCNDANLEEEFKLDAYIVGSDQVWNQQIPMEERKKFYLDFVKNSKKIAYAASIGRDEILESEKEQIGKYLDDFDYISIREKTGVNLYQPLTKNKIENVLDPTLLLNSEDWDKIAGKDRINKDYIFSYTLGAEKEVIESIDRISNKLRMGIVEIYYKKQFKNEIKNINNAGPKEFVGLVKNSKYVVTNSFHGMVFSILYRKNFWVFKRGNMNSRIYDLLQLLNLTNRIIDLENLESIENVNYEERIDYDNVYKILNNEKEKSINFLTNALGMENNSEKK